ncbi:MAG: hypothetical protein IJV56_10120 [Neisseriaceae bacterium]|nr:hypothetical protein [Neisseriaceae bacterium]
MANYDSDQDLISEEEWLKLLSLCGNDVVNAAAHILASKALGVKEQLNELAHELENSKDNTLLQDKEVLAHLNQPFTVEIEDFAHSGTNAVISVDFVADNQEPSASQERRRIDLDLKKADDADLPYGLSKAELANLLQTLDTVVVKPEFQQVRRMEVGITATPTDKNGMPLGKTETFHCAIFDANKFELVRKSEVGLSERHLGGKKPVFH